MTKLKRLATRDDSIVKIQFPLTEKDLDDRKVQYDLLTPKQFATRYNDSLFKPIVFGLNGGSHTIQYNYCINPFCCNIGMGQQKFVEVKGKPSRYKITGSSKDHKGLYCNDNPVGKGVSQNCKVTPLSNWSVAEEVKRLVEMGSIVDIEPDYQFHKECCSTKDATPFKDAKLFYKRGKSKAKSQRYQCKECKKFTNVLPKRTETTTYHQKKNSILPMLARMLVGKVSVSRSCEILGIGVGTYYHKLEWIYKRCLEFLERYETKPLQTMQFNELWLNTDKMHYYLNNVRKKGQGSKQYSGMEDLNMQTHLVVTAEALSRYVFRADIAYDWDVTLEELKEDTRILKEDHLNTFSRKNDRLDWSYYPQEPSANDTDDKAVYEHELKQIINRGKFVDGLNVSSGYTTTAHYLLIKQSLNAIQWRMISDDDQSIRNSFYRVFNKEIKLTDAHHFVCQVDKTKSRKECLDEFEEARVNLLDWAASIGYESKNLRNIASRYLTEVFSTHRFHKDTVNKDGEISRIHSNNPITHPLASKDKGFFRVDCRTDLSSLEPKEIAKMVLNVNDHSTNSFIQQIRRRISSLERPLTTARGDKKSYIYANFNPKYAQYVVTILRTYYNFCRPFKSSDGIKATPAQRLGITKKQFDWNDILYFK
ncbi:transposase [Sutcliffiella horikoshii]|uniref:transposase n=1 Tax=Sutcliffiella horikoshii TaxID=79883 RepID=UPI003CF346F7